MQRKKRILLKLSGETIIFNADRSINSSLLESIAQQIKNLSATYHFGIVMGGGNIFRGAAQGNALHLSLASSHQIGMVATALNTLIIKEVFKKIGIDCTILCATPMPQVGEYLQQHLLDTLLENNNCPLFSGGSGLPFFTTDTTAIVRALQMKATEVWKLTTVDGIYTSDPHKDPSATFIPVITHEQALAQRLQFMDTTALYLAQENDVLLRILKNNEPHILEKACTDETVGSRVVSSSNFERNSI